MTQQSNLMLEAAGQALGEISNKILDRVEGTVAASMPLRQMRDRDRRISSLPASVTPIPILLTFPTRSAA